jgi:hypothetical protein
MHNGNKPDGYCHRHIAVNILRHPAYDENHPVNMTGDSFEVTFKELFFQIKPRLFPIIHATLRFQMLV